jgi:exosome complex RNA-binding protein Rrp42 (RNase PH superfamily)
MERIIIRNIIEKDQRPDGRRSDEIRNLVEKVQRAKFMEDVEKWANSGNVEDETINTKINE